MSDNRTWEVAMGNSTSRLEVIKLDSGECAVCLTTDYRDQYVDILLSPAQTRKLVEFLQEPTPTE